MTERHLVNMTQDSPIAVLAGTTLYYVKDNRAPSWKVCAFCYGCSVVVFQKGESSGAAYSVKDPSSALTYLGGVLKASVKTANSRIFGGVVSSAVAKSAQTVDKFGETTCSTDATLVDAGNLQVALKNTGLIGGLDKAPKSDLPFWTATAVSDLTEALAQGSRGEAPDSRQTAQGGLGIDYSKLSAQDRGAPHMAPAILGLRAPAEYISVIRKAYLGTR